MNSIRLISKYVPVALLLLLVETGLIKQTTPVIVSGTLLVSLWTSRQVPKRYQILGLIVPGLLLLSVQWSTLWTGQLLTVFSLLCLLVLSEGIKISRVPQEVLARVAVLFYLFLAFLNFYVLDAQLPHSYGSVYAVGALFIFFGVRSIVAESIESFVVTLLILELLFVISFLPQGYFTLSALALLFTYILLQSVFLLRQDVTENKKILMQELGFAVGAVIIVLLMSGVRPR